MTKYGEQRDSPAVTAAASSSTATKRFWTPGRFVAILCIVNLINYVDRGVIASNGVNGSSRTCDAKGLCSAGTGIQGEFKLSNFQDGLLSSAFMVGLLVASPIFAALSKRFTPFKLIGVGLTVWTLAAVGCGFSYNFWMIAVFRMFVGVGEASFISLAAPYIDDSAPAARKNLWLGLFYMCIPAGVALGYVFGGYVGNHLGWRWAFYIEAIAMAFFVVLSFCIKPPQLKGFAAKESKKPSTSIETVALTHAEASQIKTVSPKSQNLVVVFGKDMKALFSEKVFIVNVLGYITYNFVIGAYSYWGPKAGFGGSYVLDRINATLPNTFKLLAASTLFGAAFCFAAFCMKNMYAFIGLFAVGEILIFAPQAPVNFVCLHCVRPNLRPLSMASSTVLIHILGDVPSSPLYGKMQDRLKNWRTSTLIITSILFLAAIIWGIGIFMNSVDRSNEKSDDEVEEEEKLETKADNNSVPV
ncbi:hypothetical protein Bca4012_005348 [Brassica carinata]